MKIFTILIAFILVFLWVFTLEAEIYTWIDENGVRHYSDQRPENVENVKAVFPAVQYNEAADKRRSEKEQKELQSFIQEVNEKYEKEQQKEKQKAAAQKNQPPTKEEVIADEQARLERKIAELEEKPLEFFGSQKNKRVRIGFYRYRLDVLKQDPDKYFKNPEKFQGNVKQP